MELEKNRLEKRKALGQWIKEKRETVRLTQAGLAKALGYDNAQIISNIERGVSAIPQKRISDFAKFLKCEPMELDFRVISSSAREEGATLASTLALKYFPVLRAIDEASPEVKLALLNTIAEQTNTEVHKLGVSLDL
ncbi:MAG: helix-turn-helix domain-containing protein [Bdellovibrionales bacterium]